MADVRAYADKIYEVLEDGDEPTPGEVYEALDTLVEAAELLVDFFVTEHTMPLQGRWERGETTTRRRLAVLEKLTGTTVGLH